MAYILHIRALRFYEYVKLKYVYNENVYRAIIYCV
jgi:hypothetical protein